MLMLKKRFLSLIVASLLVTGCTLPTQDNQNVVKNSSAKDKQAKGGLISLPKEAVHIDGQIRVPRQNGVGYETATIKQLYFSALGKKCIQVTAIGKAKKRLFCKQFKDEWKEMPLLGNLVNETKK